MNKIINFCKASYNELVMETSWPSRNELVGSAVLVLIASLCLAVVIFGIDTLFDKGMQFIYGLAN